MKRGLFIPVFLLLCFCRLHSQQRAVQMDFFGETVTMPPVPAIPSFPESSPAAIQDYVRGFPEPVLTPFLKVLLDYKAAHHTDDWLYYQLIRKVAQHLSPKAENYYRYTLYKWWLLARSGYDARLMWAGPYLLFYVQSNEAIYNIPSRVQDGQQYVCLNYHDYGTIDFNRHQFQEIPLPLLPGARPFSYKVTRLPSFKASDYQEQEVRFANREQQYQFRVKLNPQIKTIFTNYPVVDYSLQFNVPLSAPTYQTLIPALKKEISGMKQKEGVDFLMRFTRYAFLFRPDTEVFGAEKRFAPEQTLLSEWSDCEDRAALFFYLVKEIYNLPMLVMVYPRHVLVAVGLNKPHGATINHGGSQYTICEPSPQRFDLNVGQVLPELRKQPYEIAFHYQPAQQQGHK